MLDCDRFPLLLLHFEVVIADVLDRLVVEDSLESQFVLAHGKCAGGHIERYRISSGRGAPWEIAANQNFVAAERAKLRTESRIVVPGFQLNLDMRDLRGRIQHQLLRAAFGAREPG